MRYCVTTLGDTPSNPIRPTLGFSSRLEAIKAAKSRATTWPNLNTIVADTKLSRKRGKSWGRTA